MAGKEKKGAKFGRNRRAPTFASQPLRTARNKRLNNERAAAFAKSCKTKKRKVARGTARKRRRMSKQRISVHLNTRSAA